MATVSTVEPLAARAGDSWTWVRDLPDYPAPTWVLSYTLFAAGGVLRITAVADGAQHRVHLLPATTGLYTAGRYDWTAHVTDGTDRYQVGAGTLMVLPNLATATSYDGRTHARRMLDAIEALMEARATDGDLDLVRTTLGEQTAEFDPATLERLHRRYAAAVAAEESARRLARGDAPSRMIQTRFG